MHHLPNKRNTLECFELVFLRDVNHTANEWNTPLLQGFSLSSIILANQ